MAHMQINNSDYEALTYPRINLQYFTLDENGLAKSCPLDNGRHSQACRTNLGSLELLPLELISQVLSQLDLVTLAAFRRLNARSMQIVDSMPSYRTIIRECPGVLRGLYSIQYGSQVLVEQLWHTLGTANCQDCGDFGGYIYLLTCRRVCFRCFWSGSQYYPLRVSEASKQYGVSKRSLGDLPAMRSIPGQYSMAEKYRLTPTTLLDRETVRLRAIAIHGSEDSMLSHVKQKTTTLDATYQGKLILARSGPTAVRPRRPSPAEPTNGPNGDPRRYMAIIKAPHIDHKTLYVEWGRYCKGCERSYRNHMWRRRYVFDTFVEHLRELGDIVDGVHKAPPTV
ncbi:hypothetical protein LTR62_008055 [Meristemomyces frigidus]|uniref:F-box domain-containing protein n=1 Tax=Meristemomyces frigidus TaxID=1508187 RepID=A0AAN7THE2_9PEZI|nr:hypothetical protein LTR62_008055 [Meristemomyces frigidus]